MNFIKDRVKKAVEIEAEIKRLKSLQGKRIKAVGGESAKIAQQIERLENARKALPPKRTQQSQGNYVAFWAGGTFEGAMYTMLNPFNLNPRDEQEQASFVVTHGGTVIANHAIIRGDGYFDNGYFSGDIHSENAYIRGEIHATSGTFNGKITSNANGNRIEIDPENRDFKMINSLGVVAGRWYFSNNSESTIRIGNTEFNSRRVGNAYTVSTESVLWEVGDQGIACTEYDDRGNRNREFRVDMNPFYDYLPIFIKGLPRNTSSDKVPKDMLFYDTYRKCLDLGTKEG